MHKGVAFANPQVILASRSTTWLFCLPKGTPIEVGNKLPLVLRQELCLSVYGVVEYVQLRQGEE